MSTTITALNGAGETHPYFVLGYETQRRSRNVVFDTIGGGQVVSVIKPQPRSGVLRLFYLEEADAFHGMNLHAEETQFDLVDTDRPSINMGYVLDEGELTLALDEDGRRRWVVEVPYFELFAV